MSEQTTLGGGCFWCLEAIYQRIEGVEKVVSGYAGGETANPAYEAICTGNTGHAEVVQITFDPDKIPFAKLIDLFWSVHDPTTLNRQGNDVGTQYRSVIFFHNDEQKNSAEISKAEAQKKFREPIVTTIEPLPTFYPAEDYHQDYYQRTPNNPYCAVVIAPKLKKLGLK